MTIALGLMSGTSGDGVSLALVSFKNRSFKLLSYQTFPYSAALQKKILGAFELRAPGISRLHFELGQVFAEAALKIIRRSKIPRKKISVIGSHGQTIHHDPRGRIPSTFQIGEAAVIGEKTALSVVSDFRPSDVAAGGEGAPLIPFFDFYFFGGGPVRALQNIGGIANVTVVGKNLKQPVAFDTGPGNSLMDLVIKQISKGKFSYDPSGKYATRGRIDMKRVRSMIGHPYFQKRPPKSTGREEFGQAFVNRYLGSLIRRFPYDALATVTYFTAFTIFEGLRRFAPRPLTELIVSGGGVKNLTLMRYLNELFYPLPVRSIEEWGIPAQAKEPIAFAFFALRALQGKMNHLPSVTGARRALVLGKITRPYASR